MLQTDNGSINLSIPKKESGTINFRWREYSDLNKICEMEYKKFEVSGHYKARLFNN